MTIRTIRRRRREAKTDYKARFSLLKSGKPRLVVRKSNRYILVQLVSSDLAQDKVLASVSSKELVEKGWPKEKIGSLKSVHAAYLTGFLLAKTMKGKQPEAIFDMGMYPNVHGSRIYAALRGAVEGGLEIPHDEKVFPSDERFSSNAELHKITEAIKKKL